MHGHARIKNFFKQRHGGEDEFQEEDRRESAQSARQHRAENDNGKVYLQPK
jgi:hypothetical protein